LFLVTLFNQLQKTMNKVKTIFTVKDLENLSGIKAHTIRIWEKRYNVFTPQRTDNNTRLYQNEDLQRLLNISFLNNFGYKISKIASLSPEECNKLVKSIYNESSVKELAISDFKLAMMNFDAKLFHQNYNEIAKKNSFKDIFYTILIPLLGEIGLLWQTSTIKPSHEHFISYLIRQKLSSKIEELQLTKTVTKDIVFVLFLPENEVHDLGLMFVNAELIEKGYKTVFLGDNIPIDDLTDFKNHFDEIIFISYLTISPSSELINNYVASFEELVLKDTENKLWLLGRQVEYLQTNLESVRKFSGIEDLLNEA
jgi:MerR family transcriptional regulator, light-induced transcriptional regulator